MRRKILKAIAIGVITPLSTIWAHTSYAEAWTDKPLTMLITFGPGGPNDTVARLIADGLAKALDTSIVPTNRPGAGGTIAVSAAVRAPTDGRTMLFATSANLTIPPYLYKSLAYDFKSDLTPVIQVASAPMVLAVRSDLGVSSVQELQELARTRAGGLTYGSPGTGTTAHLCAELFSNASDIEMVHAPYTGSGPMMMGLLGGQVDLVFDGISALAAHAKEGKLRLLAVAGPERLPNYPDIPTLSEQGVTGADASFWNAVLVPASTPPEIVQRMNQELNALLKSPETQERIGSLGMHPIGGTPQELAKALENDYRKWGAAVERADIKPQ